MKPIVFLIYNNVIILITLVAMFNSYYFALLSVLLILGDGRPITANSDIYIIIDDKLKWNKYITYMYYVINKISKAVGILYKT